MSFTIAGTAPVRERSLSMQVESTLARMLWDGSLKPRDRTSIRDLAEQLGVSTMPVREAVGRLVAQGALQVERNRAVVVPMLSVADFRDLTEARLLIEGHAARLAAARCDAALLEELRRIDAAFARAMSDPASRDAVKINQRLHFLVYDAAGSPTLSRIIEMNWLRAGPMINLDIGQDSKRLRNTRALAAHRALIAALERGDGEAAERAVRRDIRSAAESIVTHALARADPPRTD